MGRVKYAKAQSGNRFVLTELGFENPRIRAKYEESGKYSTLYKYTVPTAWVDKGYVQEAKEDAHIK